MWLTEKTFEVSEINELNGDINVVDEVTGANVVVINGVCGCWLDCS